MSGSGLQAHDFFLRDKRAYEPLDVVVVAHGHQQHLLSCQCVEDLRDFRSKSHVSMVAPYF